MPIVIREYTESDFKQVSSLFAELQDHIGKIDPLKLIKQKDEFDGEAYTKEMLKEYQEKNGIFLMAVYDQKVVGCILCFDEPPINEVSHHKSKHARISELVIADGVRGKGVGTLLMNEVEKRYKEAGCEYLRVECFSPNTSALSFYKKLGYDERIVELIKKL